MANKKVKSLRINGRVINSHTRLGIVGLKVEAWDKDLILDDLIGSTTTDEQGIFHIEFDETYFKELFLDRAPDLFFKVFRGSELIKSTESSVLWNAEAESKKSDIVIEVDIQAPAEHEPQVERTFYGRLLDQKSGAPLIGFTVRALLVEAGADATNPGSGVTDHTGAFTVNYNSPGRDSTKEDEQRLRLHILDAKGNEIFQTDIYARQDQSQALNILIPIPAVEEPPPITLNELADKTNLQLSQELISFLSAKGIHTLADIRKAGDLGRLQGLPPSADRSTLQMLEAQANLSLLSPDVSLNAALVAKGYTSIRAVAGATRSDFVSATHEQAGDFKAAQMYAAARAQTSYLNNVAVQVSSILSNNGGETMPHDFPPFYKDFSDVKCECEDCQAAVSPLAYLADLLDYAISYLKKDDDLIDLQYLINTFHQPFADLPTSCEDVNKQVRQVRLCIEALRSYLNKKYLALDTKSLNQYLLEAYKALLIKLGTSYKEVRLARTHPPEKKLALADRLGIDLEAQGVDHIQALFLDSEAAAAQPNAITEQALEKLFGLVDTTRDALSEGIKLGDTPTEIWRWNLKGVSWGNNTDKEGMIYVRLKRLSSVHYRVELYQDKQRTLLTASGERTFGGIVDLSGENESGLSGSFDISAYSDDSDAVEISVIPSVLSWRLQHLRTVWNQQDWPSEIFGDGVLIIDPDVIGPDDLRHPVDGEPVFDLWQTRRSDVDAILDDLKTAREANGLDHILKQVLGDPLPDLQALQNNLSSGTDLENTHQIITGELHLSLESFNRLMEIKAKDVELDPEKKPTDSEWSEVYSILTQAEKLKKYPAWLAEEEAKTLTLNPKQFWIAIKEPGLTQWLASAEARQQWQQALKTRSRAPIIDPDLIGSGDLKNSNGNDPAYKLWDERYKWVTNTLLELKATREAEATAVEGLNIIVENTLGVPLAELLALDADYKKGNSIKARLDQLSLPYDAFTYLLSISELASKDAPVLLSEWSDIYSILAQVQKRRAFADWRDQERNAGVVLSQDSFRIPEPVATEFPPKEEAQLQAWLASLSARLGWQDDLQSRIDQEKAVTAAFYQAVSAVEGEVLPMLRDALVMASDAEGNTLNSKAGWITDALLIDAKVSGCQKTTRIAQAIETLQNLLFSARTNQLQDLHAELSLDAEDFDKTWEWIGSYATWRAAMFVFIYPENILIPTLRMSRKQTPAFRALVESLRANRRISPDQAREAANRYALYFRDVCTLDLKACCQDMTRLFNHEISESNVSGYSCVLYAFARGNTTGRVYWSTCNPEAPSGSSLTFWKELDEMGKVFDIIGAVPYHISAERRFIYLFARKQGEERQELVFIRYDLEQRIWDEKPETLNLPSDASNYTFVLNQNRIEDEPPEVIFHGEDGFYVRPLNIEGMEWRAQPPSKEEWSYFKLNASGDSFVPKVKKLLAVTKVRMFGESDQDLYCYADKDDEIVLQYGINVGSNKLGKFKWLGAFVRADGQAYFFLRDALHVVYYHLKSLKHGSGGFGVIFQGAKNFIAASLSKLPPTSSTAQLSKQMIAYEVSQSQAGTYANYFKTDGDPLSSEGRQRIVPLVSGPFEINEYFSEEELQIRRQAIKTAFQANLGSPPTLLVYLEEAYYFVPVHLALRLQARGQYIAALDWFRTVYDYSAPTNQKIYYGLTQEQFLPIAGQYEREADWLLDPLNPHEIAATRINAYTRFTLLSIVRCLLEYADAEFTRDTAESIPRARTLYMTALKLLDSDTLSQHPGKCEELMLDIEVGQPQVKEALKPFKKEMANIADVGVVKQLVNSIKEVLSNDRRQEASLAEIRSLVAEATAKLPPAPRLGQIVERKAERTGELHTALLAQPEIAEAAARVGAIVGNDYQRAVSLVSGIRSDFLERRNVEMPWLRQRANADKNAGSGIQARSNGMRKDYKNLTKSNPFAPTYMATLAKIASESPLQFVSVVRHTVPFELPAPVYHFCIPPNPVPKALRLHAELNLFKLRNCRNIAGVVRELELYAAPTDTISGLPMIGAGGQLVLPGLAVIRPTLYRYSALIERAKQLVSLAQQIEAAFLSALEKLDAESYSVLRARQDIRLAQAGVQLQTLRVKEAEGGVKLAELQQERAQYQADHYRELLDEGPSLLEDLALSFMAQSAAAHFTAAALAGIGLSAATASSETGAGLSTISSMLSTLASYQRRAAEWEFQMNLALSDVRIGSQQVKIAEDHVRVAGQERVIAQMQTEHAEAVLDFLSNKFTNVELYDWMSSVLETVYSYFLQQATAMAQMAANQLAFERQEVPPPFIQLDYWKAPGDSIISAEDGKAVDRRGLTGSARLLQDIYQLDQHAFDTDRRKLQLSKTISLARLMPFEFQRLRESGVMTFATPMELFDRDFPGHYLRLIRRVRTSVIALIPPTYGIRASLSTTGISRVVIGGDVFQTVVVNAGPQSVALSSPREATGLFELDQQPEKLLPFEGIGVDTTWEFHMPKAANPFDYRTIADVLITIEYTALNSFDYRQQITQSLDSRISADRPFSFRHQFPDQWYDLHNPDQTATPMTVRFTTDRNDFPPNLEDLQIEQILLYFSMSSGKHFNDPQPVVNLWYSEYGSQQKVGGEGIPIDGIISTLKGNASSWYVSITGKAPIGEWELILPNTDEIKGMFNNGDIEDALFMITFSGRTPPWPA